MTDNCPSCGVKWSKHPGVQTMCRKLITLRRTNDQWRNRAIAAEALSDLYLKGMKRAAAAWKLHYGLPKYEPGISEIMDWVLANAHTKKRMCQHGNTVGQCSTCDDLADRAFDTAREGRVFGGRK